MNASNVRSQTPIYMSLAYISRGYQYFSEAARMPHEYRYLRIKLQIEQQRFLNFALESGILHADGAISTTLQVNRSLLLALLAEIKTLLEKYAATNGKYERILRQGETTHSNNEESEVDLMALLCLSSVENDPTTSEAKGERDNYLKKIGSLGKCITRPSKTLRKIIIEPKRLVWATFGKEEFHELALRLEHLNSFLIALLDASQSKRLQDAMNASYLEILQIRNDVKSLTGLVEALSQEDRDNKKSEVATIPRANSDPLSAAMAEENATQEKQKKYLKRLAEIKIQYTRMDSGLSDDSTASTLFTPVKRALDLSHFAFSVEEWNRRRRTNADYQGRSVWIEWKDLPLNHMGPNSTPAIENRIQLLTELLCGEKPEGFRSPPCVGYVKSTPDHEVVKSIASRETVKSTASFKTRYGIVFEKPPRVGAAMKPVTLYQLLEDYPRPRPSLSARISLCATLSECLYSFHAVNWLHKGLSSNNILFFAHDSIFPDLSAPYVSGFELSRPNSLVEMTERPAFDASQDIYRHPSAQSGLQANNFRKAYDMYSLGIVLIEVATWERIDKIMGFENLDEIMPRQLREVRPRLLGYRNTPSLGGASADNAPLPSSSFLDRVAGDVGDVYRTVVEVCLGADEIEKPMYRGESDVSVTVRLQRMMEEDVVRRLRALESAMNF
jgi:hypothetical protein